MAIRYDLDTLEALDHLDTLEDNIKVNNST